jgi:hypothetical protein
VSHAFINQIESMAIFVRLENSLDKTRRCKYNNNTVGETCGETMDEINPAILNSIYTIGHSNHSSETFLHLLKSHGIQVLIDTRSAPFSRYSPQFNRDSLKAAVQEAGIKYGFYGRHLGGRPDNEAFYDETGRVVYSQVAKSFLFNEGMERLTRGLQKFRTALLCSEEDPNICHRRLLVSRVLFEQGIDVYHIRGDGRLESECELQEAEAKLAREREWQVEQKRLTAERKSQEVAAQRDLHRQQKSDQRQQKNEAVRLEKECIRQVKIKQQAAEREQRVKERKRQTAERKMQRDIARRKKMDTPKRSELPRLFDMEEK